MSLPCLVYLAALGRRDELGSEVERARDAAPTLTGRAYCHRRRFRRMLFLQRVSGAMSKEEVARWRGWLRAHDGRVTDPVADLEDRRPRLFEAATDIAACARHPRAFVRQAVFNRPAR